jgi:cobalt-zinc-cadmium efflux system outer membrane protein
MRRIGLPTRCVLGVVTLSAWPGGCTRYEARPLNPAAHRERLLARTPESAEVGAFAASLRERDGSGTGFDLRDGVTLAEGEATAMVFNADLRAARLRAGVSRAVATSAGLWRDPVVGVDLARVVESAPHPWEGGIELGLTIPVSGRLSLEKERAGLAHAADLARVAELEWRVRMDLRRAWARWSALRACLDETRELVEHLGGIVGVVDAGERAGEMARAEAGPFRIERALREAELASLEAACEEAALEVHRLMGLSPLAALRLEPSRLGGVEARTEEADAFCSSPLLAVALAEYEVAEKTLELAVRGQYPEVVLAPGVGRDDGENQVRIGVSVPLPLFNANRREIAESRAAREAARAACEAAVERLEVEARAARARLAGARRQREALERGLAPLVEARYADVRRTIERGGAPAHAILDALTRRYEARVRLIEAARDETLAAIRLDEIAGPPGGRP